MKPRVAAFAIGLLCAAVLVEAGVRLFGLAVSGLQARHNRVALSRPGTYRILCLGDSMTTGPYPGDLEKILNDSARGLRFSVINEGRIGTTSRHILEALPGHLARYKPDMVVVMMGANDGRRLLPYGEVPVEDKSWLKSLRLGRFLRYLLAHQDDRPPPRAGSAPRRPPAARPEDRRCAAMIARAGENMAQRRLDRAEALLRRCARLCPSLGQVHMELANLHHMSGAPGAVLAEVEKAVELTPGNTLFLLRLGNEYLQRGAYQQAEEVLRKALDPQTAAPPMPQQAHGALAACYEALGRKDLAREHRRLADAFRAAAYPDMTRDNYRKLRELVRRRGARLVCVQYPRRPLASLRALFDDPSGIVFVDNDGPFQKALRDAPATEYFVDFYAGEFGHCTPKGYRLIAQDIADTLFKEVFRD